MILDNIKNVGYYNFPKEMDEVLEFLKAAPSKEEGRYDLSNGIYMLVMSYTTQGKSECKLENHKRFIDLQYVVDGEEEMGIAFEGKSINGYDEEKDVEFYDSEVFVINLKKGDFAFLFPQDYHMPKLGNGTEVKKVVAKIPVELFNK